jgi:hypothetical protein
MRAGSPASAATSRRAERRPRSCSGRTAMTSGSSTRSRTGTRSASGPTSRSTRSRTTRCTSPATARSAASLHSGRFDPTRRARRPLGRLGQIGMRHPRRHTNRRQMTDHIYAAEHPETTHVRPGGFTLWFTVCPARARRRSRTSSVRSSTGAAHRRIPRRGHGAHAPLEGLGFSKEDRDTHIERVGWVASR